MVKDPTDESLEIQINQDLFLLENWAFAVWGDILASNPGIMNSGSGSLRTIVLSDASTLVANVFPTSRSAAVTVSAENTTATHGGVTLDIVFRSHYLVSAHHHQKSPTTVRAHWVERCFHVIEKIETGMVVLIPTSDAIARQLLRGRASVDMGDGQRLVRLGSGTELLVWRHHVERVERCAAQRAQRVEPGIFRELDAILKKSSRWN